MTNWISAIFDAMGSIATNFGTFLSNLFQGIVNLFYQPGATEGAAGSITFLGVLLLIAVVGSLVFWGFRFISGLIGRIGKNK